MATQSTTLAQAVREYRRRYGRRPPAGFDKWFAFAQGNGVQLLDEYDTIETSLAPFRSLPLDVLQKRKETLESWDWTYTISVKDGKITLKGAHKHNPRAIEQAALIEEVAKWLPDVDIVMSAQDGPSVVLDHNLKQAHLKATAEGRTLSHQEAETTNDDSA